MYMLQIAWQLLENLWKMLLVLCGIEDLGIRGLNSRRLVSQTKWTELSIFVYLPFEDWLIFLPQILQKSIEYAQFLIQSRRRASCERAALRKEAEALNIMRNAYTQLLQQRPPPRGPGAVLSDADKFRLVWQSSLTFPERDVKKSMDVHLCQAALVPLCYEYSLYCYLLTYSCNFMPFITSLSTEISAGVHVVWHHTCKFNQIEQWTCF